MNRFPAHRGARRPIVEASMGWNAPSPVASALCNAAGLGIIETSPGKAADCQAEKRKIRDLTGAAFGICGRIGAMRTGDV